MSIEGRTERTTKSEKACPYRATRMLPEHLQFGTSWDCGEHGWLCPACREDRADARTLTIEGAIRRSTDRLVEGLALASLLGSKTGRDDKAKRDGVSGVEFLCRAAGEFAAALREREGGGE